MLNLKIALGDTSTTRGLKSGDIAIKGVNPEFVQVNPIIAAFRHMVRDLAYDVCRSGAHDLPDRACPWGAVHCAADRAYAALPPSRSGEAARRTDQRA